MAFEEWTDNGIFDWAVPVGVTTARVRLVPAGFLGFHYVMEHTFTDLVHGETLRFTIGGTPALGGEGGANGGGDGEAYTETISGEWRSTAGFGATDLRRGGTSSADRVLVAGGRSGVSFGAFSSDGGATWATGTVDGWNDATVLATLPSSTDPPRATPLPPGDMFATDLLEIGSVGGAVSGGIGATVLLVGPFDNDNPPNAGDRVRTTAPSGGGGYGGEAGSSIYTGTVPNNGVATASQRGYGASYPDGDQTVEADAEWPDGTPGPGHGGGFISRSGAARIDWDVSQTTLWAVGHLAF